MIIRSNLIEPNLYENSTTSLLSLLNTREFYKAFVSRNWVIIRRLEYDFANMKLSLVLFSELSQFTVTWLGQRMSFLVNNAMNTYTQVRDAFSYFYPKRKVLADGVSTTPLDI